MKGDIKMVSKKSKFSFVTLMIVSSILTFLVGCASFPPAHEHSFYNKKEEVTVNMLTCDKVSEEYRADWKGAFKQIKVKDPECFPKEEKAVPIAVAVGIVTPLAVDYVKGKLKEEGDNYVQQFGTTYFSNDFWILDKTNKLYIQKYYGFEIIRKAQRYNEDDSNKTEEDAFKLIYGLAEDGDGFFWVAPLYFKTSKSKAKVSDWGGKHKITTKVELSLDSVWRDKENKFHKENVAKFDSLLIPNYDVDSRNELRSSCETDSGTCHPLKGGLNSFAGIPISTNSSVKEIGGKFWITILVTENDTAKTKKYITDLSELIDKNRDKVIDFVKEQVTPQDTK